MYDFLFALQLQSCIQDSDFKRGQNIEAKARASRPRSELWGLGQSYEAEARTMRSRPRPRLKIIMKKYQIMINIVTTYGLRLLPEKLTKFPNLTRFLHEKCPIT